MIEKLVIQNFRRFEWFKLEFEPGMNVVVGDNDSGKSTLIEAISLALTGRFQGRSLSQEFSPFLVNLEATRKFIQALKGSKGPPVPPEVVIDLFLEPSDGTEILRGTNNLLAEDACGVRLRGSLWRDFQEEYESFASKPDQVLLVPTEYYQVEWLGFSGNAVTARSIPATVSIIDPASIRPQTGTDYHLQQIIRTHLEPRERVELSREYRSLREAFGDKPSIKAVNEKLAGDKGDISDRELSLSIDISQRFTWENSLVAHLDELPFPYIGKGEQNSVKTLLAISRRAEESHVVLIEEPENHLSFSSLRSLIAKVEKKCEGKQVIVATHSSFVLNKLGLNRLILLGNGSSSRLTDLPTETTDYFKKLSGYDTLRLVLAKRAILVEGPSDELVVQRAYRDIHGSQPIDVGVDVISVRGLSFKRFLDLSVGLGRRVAVVTDNDGKSTGEVLDTYSDYLGHEEVSVHIGHDPASGTLEPQIVAANDLDTLNRVLNTAFESKKELVHFMMSNKTTVALAIFESDESIVMPEYIREAVAD